MQIEGKGFSWMRVIGKSRVFARPHPFPNSFHSTLFLCMTHLSRPQYLDDFASKFSPRFDMVIVHLSKMHFVESNVKEHLEGLKRNAACCKMNIYARS